MTVPPRAAMAIRTVTAMVVASTQPGCGPTAAPAMTPATTTRTIATPSGSGSRSLSLSAATGDGHQVLQEVEAAVADAGDLAEIVDGPEWVGCSVGDDLVGGDLSDAGQGVELLGRGGVQVERDAWRTRAAGGTGPAGLGGAGGQSPVGRRGDAGRLDRVEDPAALGQADEPWVLDSPDDVDGDGGARRLAGGGAIAALGGTVGPGTRQDQACPAAAGGRGGWRVGGTRLGVQPQGSGGGQGQDSDDGDGDALARDAVEQALEAGPPAGGLHDEGGRR